MTNISWTDETANFWMGCAKVSAGCKHCYAETLIEGRFNKKLWGPGSGRQEVSNVHAKIRTQARLAGAGEPGVMGPGRPRLIFVGSLMDVFEDHPDANRLRPGIWKTVREHPELHFQLLTKRAENVARFLPDDWGRGWPNVWLGTSIEDARAAQRADELRRIPATVRFISYEPALGPLDELNLDGIHWVIYGGESGPNRRPEDKNWARTMRDRCRRSGIAFFHKQSSAARSGQGERLDGEIIKEFPTDRLRRERIHLAMDKFMNQQGQRSFCFEGRGGDFS